MNHVKRIQAVLDRMATNPLYPYPTRFVATEVPEGIRVEADSMVPLLETGQLGRGIMPDVCSAIVPADATERDVALAARKALITLASHEVDEMLTIDGAHVVEPHPAI